MKTNKIIVIITSIIIIIISLLTEIYPLIFWGKSYDKINEESNIDMYVIKLQEKKGVLILNDSIVISGNSHRLKIKLKGIEKNDELLYYDPMIYLPKPFRFIKRKKNDTITIIKDSDTLFYKYFQ